MDELIFDPQALRDTADLLVSYCAGQRECIEQYLARIGALCADWDDPTFCRCMEAARMLAHKANARFDEMLATYPRYFRDRATYLEARTHIALDTVGTPATSAHSTGGTAEVVYTTALPAVRQADLGGYAPEVVTEAAKALGEAKKDFPGLDIPYLGTISSQKESLRKVLTEHYRAECLKKYGNTISEERRERIVERCTETALSFTKGVSPIAWSLNVPASCDPTGGKLTLYAGIAINDTYAADGTFFHWKKIAEEASGNKPIGCGIPRATVDHELGHEIDRHLGARKDPEIRKLYDEFCREDNHAASLSHYACKNIAEFIAEAYSEYRNNPTPRYYATAVYNRLLRLRGNRE